MEVEKFTFLKIYGDSISKLAEWNEQLAKDLCRKIVQYWIYWINEDSNDPILEALFIQIKNMIDKGKEISRSKSKSWKNHSWNQYTQWDEKRKTSQEAQKKAVEQNGTNVEQNWNEMEQHITYNIEHITDNKEHITNNIKQETNISLSKDKETETKVSEKWKKEINELIFLLKQEANNLWIAYDPTNERKFAKHILTAKEFWSFCEKIWQTRNEFAINLMKASIHINYRKWICSWPQKIYQNYAEVYNKTMEMKSKLSKNLIQSF